MRSTEYTKYGEEYAKYSVFTEQHRNILQYQSGYVLPNTMDTHIKYKNRIKQARSKQGNIRTYQAETGCV